MASIAAESKTDSQIIISNSLVLFIRRLVLLGFSGVLVIFLPRYLGDQGLGQLAFASSFAALFGAALSLGVGKFLVKEIARDRTRVTTYLFTAIGMRLLMALVVFAVIATIASLLDYSSTATRVMYIVTIAWIVTSFAHLMTSVLHGLENMSWPAVAESASKLVVVVAGVTVLVLGYGVVAYASVLLAAAIMHLALNTGYVGRRFSLGLSLPISRVKTLIMGGAPFLLMGFLLNIYNAIDVVMLRFYTSEAVVGWYSAAVHLYGTFQMVPGILTTALLPTLARMHSTNAQTVISVAKKSITVGALAIVPVALGVSLLSEEIIDILPYPDAFQNSVPLLAILALSIPITAFLMILGTIAIAVDRQKAWAFSLLATVVLNVVLNVIFIPYFHSVHGNGAIGPALTTLVSEAVMVLIGVRLMPKGVVDRPMAIYFLKVGVSGGLMALIVLIAKYLGLETVPVVAIGVITYGILVLGTRAVTVKDLLFVRDSAFSRLRRARTTRVS